MRYLLFLALLGTACTDVPVELNRYDSVRDRMSAVPTYLYVHDEASSGAVTARRRGSDGWITGSAELAIERGYMRARIDDEGQLQIDQLSVDIAPIALEGVFQKPAELQDVQLRLAQPVRSPMAWASADDATASLVMLGDFDWGISLDGADSYLLATQQLPPQTVQVAFTGSGDHIEASLAFDAAGELWTWADIIQVTNLSLSLTAMTAD
ncbi:MAG TPA: hypothetical protein VIV40_15295 [Kofleriaceae bacterium]